jgi:hypothetical protein
MFNKFKTRKGRLEQKIIREISSDTTNIENILKAVDDYQKDNVNTIQKLKKEKKVEMNRINGALKQAINAHGPIKKELIGSAGKRIYGSLIVNPNQQKKKKTKISLRDITIGIVLGIAITSVILLVL